MRPATGLDSDYLAGRAISDDRARAYRRLLGEIESALGPMPIQDIAALSAFLDARADSGVAPNTVRKDVGMLRALYRWMYQHGIVSADTYLAMRAITPPRESSRRVRPQPYRRTEIAALWTTLDERWPTLPPDEAWRWIDRWREGRSPYSRVRCHAIRCQLDAIISLALYCGLRRSEIFRLDEKWMHDDNFGVIVWDAAGPWERKHREVPYTDSARSLIAPWMRMRKAIGPAHARAWLNLWSEPTVRAPMSRDTFDKLMRTYVGPGWTLRRLRDTCGVGWAKANLPPEHLRQVLGYSSLHDVLPYLGLIGGDVGRLMNRLDGDFSGAGRAGRLTPR